MRVLQVNVTQNTGSTGRIAEAIGQSVIKDGGESYVAYGRDYNPDGMQSLIYRVGNNLDTYSHVLKTRLFDGHGLASKRATKQFVNWTQKLQPDIIHLHNIHGYYLNYPILFDFLKQYKRPVVWTLHDCWAFTGHCSHFESIGCNLWKTECRCCPNKLAYPKSIGLDNSRRNFRLKENYFTSLQGLLTLVPVSNWLCKLLNLSFFKDIGSIEVIKNGINLSLFKPQQGNHLYLPFTLPKNIKHFYLSVSQKGLEDIKYFSSRYLEKDEAIIVVGLSKEEIRHSRQSRKIFALGKIDSNSMTKIYSLCDAYLNFTHGDTYPTTNLESIASGTPVITYETGGSPESITNDTGFVVQKGDYSAVRNALNIIRSRGKDYYSIKCRQYAELHFDINKCLKMYINLYSHLLNPIK